jgi:hypothetical protein
MGAGHSVRNADFQDSSARARRGALLSREELPSVESVRTDIPAAKCGGRSLSSHLQVTSTGDALRQTR